MNGNRMTRRDFLTRSAMTAASAAGAGLLACGTTVGDTEHTTASTPVSMGSETDRAGKRDQEIAGFAGRKPNIITILCDDLDGATWVLRQCRDQDPEYRRAGAPGSSLHELLFLLLRVHAVPVRLLSGRYPVRSGLIFVLPASNESPMRFMIRRLGRWFGSLGAVDVQDDCWVDGLPTTRSRLPARSRRLDTAPVWWASGTWAISAQTRRSPASARL